VTRRAPLLGALALLLPGIAAAECPPAAELLGTLHEANPGRGSRTARYGSPPPAALYGKAATHPGQPHASHDGSRGFAVMVAPLPVERLWMALNDEEHHALDGGYLPVKHSEVIGGTPRGAHRLLFQYFQRMCVGRWWVSHVSMNRELYERSGGRLWEVYWEDAMDEVDPTRPPLDSVSVKMAPIRRSEGAWLLVPVAPACTLVEHFSWSEPGGVAGALRPLVLDRALRDTVGGLARMAAEHFDPPEIGASFVRPDGTPLLRGDPDQ